MLLISWESRGNFVAAEKGTNQCAGAVLVVCNTLQRLYFTVNIFAQMRCIEIGSEF